jgi:hypothetical protein
MMRAERQWQVPAREGGQLRKRESEVETKWEEFQRDWTKTTSGPSRPLAACGEEALRPVVAVHLSSLVLNEGQVCWLQYGCFAVGR